MTGRWLVLALAAMGLFGGVLAGAAVAAPPQPVIEIPAITCANPPLGDPQVCTPLFAPQHKPKTSGVLRIQYTAANSHCSTVSVRMFVDGVLAQTTPFLAPGEASQLFDLSAFLTKPRPKLAFQAVGEVGGCNTGQIGSWAGTLYVETQ